MTLNADTLAARVSSETGLDFVASGGRTAGGIQSYQLRPAHHPPAHTFTLHVQVEWRSVDLSFRAGNFSAELIREMGLADESGRLGFVSVLCRSQEGGAQIGFLVNGRERNFDDPSIWDVPWQKMSLSMRRGMLSINQGDLASDEALIGTWVTRMSAAILALLPLESNESSQQISPAEAITGFPEGAKVAVTVNRYERDRRNRAAALAIHGYVCKVCDVDMGWRYGVIAAGLIEIHHTTPVSQLGPNYVVDPAADLVPLCPNCHAVAHRRDPPFPIDELRGIFMGLKESDPVGQFNPST
jgi:5-methylcytosine-specific restriction enzyme A